MKKRQRRRGFSSVLLLGVMLLPANAQEVTREKKPEAEAPREAPSSDPGLPTVEQIIDSYIEALGGRTAMEKHSSRVLRAAFEIPAMGLISKAEILSKSPDRWLLTIDIPGYGLVQQAFDGTSGWVRDPQAGLREVAESELAALKRSSVFNQPLKIRELYPSMKVTGKKQLGALEFYIVEATPDEGFPENMYFDAATHLLVRADMEAEGPQGKMPFELTFGDYKPVDGVLMAHTVTRASPAVTFVLRLEEVRHNVDIEDSRFRKPAEAPVKPHP